MRKRKREKKSEIEDSLLMTSTHRRIGNITTISDHSIWHLIKLLSSPHDKQTTTRHVACKKVTDNGRTKNTNLHAVRFTQKKSFSISCCAVFFHRGIWISKTETFSYPPNLL